ncbi:DNA-binding transcriptional MocR family regulator [Bradyrhizobium sp. GM7.3]
MTQIMNQSKPHYHWAERARDTVAPAVTETTHDNLIQFGGGYGFPDAFPDAMSEAMCAAESKRETLQYGPLYGLSDLRDTIVDYLRQDGIAAARHNILIVNGAKHGLDLACRIFLEAGDPVIVTAPTYVAVIHILKGAGAHLISIPQDKDGMDAEILRQLLRARQDAGEPMPKLLFDMPDLHNPTGKQCRLLADRRLSSWRPSMNSSSLKMTPIAASGSNASRCPRSKPSIRAA